MEQTNVDNMNVKLPKTSLTASQLDSDDEERSRFASFTFPTLSPDGSTNLGSTTPPAALSSLGRRLAMHIMEGSTSSLTDYDMIDEASDLSIEDQETASIATEDQHEELAGLIDGVLVDFADSDKSEGEESDIEDEVEDLETPRQSTVHELESPKLMAGKSEEEDSLSLVDKLSDMGPVYKLRSLLSGAGMFVACCMLTIVLRSVMLPGTFPTPDVRRTSLAENIAGKIGLTRAAELDLTTLIPDPGNQTEGMFDTPSLTSVKSIDSHLFLLSLPLRDGNVSSSTTKASFRELVYTQILLDDRESAIAHKVTRIIDGVHLIETALHTSEMIVVNFGVKTGMHAVETYTANFHDYSKSSPADKQSQTTGVSLGASKDLATARARLLSDKVGNGTSALIMACRNAADKARVSTLRFSNEVLSDLNVARKDVVKFTKDLQTFVGSTARSSKALVPSRQTLAMPLSLSRERAMSFRDILAKSRKRSKSTSLEGASSIGKDLSTYVQNNFIAPTKDDGHPSLLEIARCSMSKDYASCRVEQAFNKALGPHHGPKSCFKSSPKSCKPGVKVGPKRKGPLQRNLPWMQ